MTEVPRLTQSTKSIPSSYRSPIVPSATIPIACSPRVAGSMSGRVARDGYYHAPVFFLLSTGEAKENCANGDPPLGLAGPAQPAFLRRLICSSDSSTWREKTYSAGRWLASEISGAISPSVVTPFNATRSAFSGCFTESTTAVAS